MFTSFHIERFRGIPKLDIEGLKPINFLVGKNNTGKTSVLEAIFLLCGATDPMNTVKIASLRGQQMNDASEVDIAWRSLFFDLEAKANIMVEGVSEGDKSRQLLIGSIEYGLFSDSNSLSNGAAEIGGRKYIQGISSIIHCFGTQEIGSNDKPFSQIVNYDQKSGTFITDELGGHRHKIDKDTRATLLSSRSFFNLVRDTELYGYFVRNRIEGEVVNALQLVDSRIKSLSIIAESSGATVYADMGGPSLVPLAVCGEGMLRVFSIVVALVNCANGVLLIDEIDNGLHHSVMMAFWPLLRELCTKHHVQLFATTHNDEMLRHAIEAFRDDFSKFALLRIDRNNDGLRAVSYSPDALEGVLETGWEVRG